MLLYAKRSLFKRFDSSYLGELVQLQFKMNHGAELSPDVIVENVIDGLRFPLAEIAHKANGIKKSACDYAPEEFFRKTFTILRLGIYYSWLLDMWDECVWTDWYIDIGEEFDIVRQADLEMVIVHAISFFRQQHFGPENVLLFFQFWSSLDEKSKKVFFENPSIQITGYGKKSLYTVEKQTDEAMTFPTFSALIFDAQEFIQQMHSKEMLLIKFPKNPKINLDIILKAFGIIYSICEKLERQIPDNIKLTSVDVIKKHCPVIPIKELQKILKQVLQIDSQSINEIMKFLTHSGNLREEIWIKPLVAINDKYLIPLLSPIIDPNLIRMVEKWMQEGGINLEDKGVFFERQVRQEIEKAINSSKIIENAGMYPYSLKKKDFGEEIDIILWIRDKVLIGEIKCVLFPSNPRELYNYYQILHNASN